MEQLAERIADAVANPVKCWVDEDTEYSEAFLQQACDQLGPWVVFRPPTGMSDPQRPIAMAGFRTKKEAENFCVKAERNIPVHSIMRALVRFFEDQTPEIP